MGCSCSCRCVARRRWSGMCCRILHRRYFFHDNKRNKLKKNRKFSKRQQIRYGPSPKPPKSEFNLAAGNDKWWHRILLLFFFIRETRAIVITRNSRSFNIITRGHSEAKWNHRHSFPREWLLENKLGSLETRKKRFQSSAISLAKGKVVGFMRKTNLFIYFFELETFSDVLLLNLKSELWSGYFPVIEGRKVQQKRRVGRRRETENGWPSRSL